MLGAWPPSMPQTGEEIRKTELWPPPDFCTEAA